LGLFSSSSSGRQPLLFTATPEDLRALGEVAFGGPSVNPPGISGIPTAEFDAYALTFLTAAGFPPSGSSAWSAASGQFLNELSSIAEQAGDWGFVGAMLVAWNCVLPAWLEDDRCRRILDRALEVLRLDGVSYAAVPPFAIDRWTSCNGYGEIGPAGWPSPLASLPVPKVESAPPAKDLADGEMRKLAQAPANPANMIFAERRADGSIQAVVEGPDPETGMLRRWDWDGLRAADYPSFLRELGDRLVTRTQWAHDDLIAYFPCRLRSRNEMRTEAKAWDAPVRTVGS
jgi:hypothetical protein